MGNYYKRIKCGQCGKPIYGNDSRFCINYDVSIGCRLCRTTCPDCNSPLVTRKVYLNN